MVAEKKIKEAASEALSEGFQLYEVNIIPGKRELRIRVLLDKLTDRFGAPTISDCAGYSRRFSAKLEELVSEGFIGEDYALEVSSPGAERELKETQDWERFRELPMKISWIREDGEVVTLAVKFEKLEKTTCFWTLYEKTPKKGKKKTEQEKDLQIELDKVKKVKLYLG